MLYSNNSNITDPVCEYGKPIWERLFMARVPAKAIPSNEEIRLYGFASVNDPYYDSVLSNQLISVMITINDMVEYHRNGVTVYISNHSDTKEIYDIIKKYLNAWLYKIERGINVAIAPIDDLLLLDKFSGVVYPHAKEHFKSTDRLNDVLSQMGGLGSKKLSMDFLENNASKTKPTVPEHSSMAEILTEGIVNRYPNNLIPDSIASDEPKSEDQPFTFRSKWM